MSTATALINNYSRDLNEEGRQKGVPIDPIFVEKKLLTSNIGIGREPRMTGFFGYESSDDEGSSGSDSDVEPNITKKMERMTLPKDNIPEKRTNYYYSDGSSSEEEEEPKPNDFDLMYDDIISFSKTVNIKDIKLKEAKKIPNLMHKMEKGIYSPEYWKNLDKKEKIRLIVLAKDKPTFEDIIQGEFGELTESVLFNVHDRLINSKNPLDKKTWDRIELWKSFSYEDKKKRIDEAKQKEAYEAYLNAKNSKKGGGTRRNKNRTTMRRNKSNISKKRQYKKTGSGISKKQKTTKKRKTAKKRR